MGLTPLFLLQSATPKNRSRGLRLNFGSQFEFTPLDSIRAQHSQFAPGVGHPAVHSSVWLFLYEYQQRGKI